MAGSRRAGPIMTSDDGDRTGPLVPGRHETPRAPGSDRFIGPYKLIQEIGHGGMGSVYLAARADAQYERRAAIKVVRSGAASEDVIRYFRRERQILASLDHPNIARLLDGGTTEDGLPYFVMEYIEGQPIHRYCDAHRLSTIERLKLFRSVCSAVEYAHRNLIVHRDIKPSNILVTADGVPRLLDFGIGKILNPGLPAEGLAAATQMALTPEYASPEQVQGKPITTGTDVYSLGIVLYELLTGRHPYRLKNRRALAVLRAVTEEEPEKPSTAVGRTEPIAAPEHDPLKAPTAEAVSLPREGTPEKLKRRLKGDLDNIVMMALRKEPQQRYPSVEALSEDIRRYLEGRPVMARKTTLAYRTGKYVRRNRVGLLVAGLVFLLLSALGINTAVQSARVARERDGAAQERTKAQRVAAFLVDLFRVSDPSEARGNTVTAREMLDKGATKIETELKDQPEVRATLMDTMGQVYSNLGLYDKALPLLQESLKTRRQVLGSEHQDVAATLNNLAGVLRETGDYAGAAVLMREALMIQRKLHGNEHPTVAQSLGHLAIVLAEQGDYTGAEPLFRESLAIQRKLLGNEHPTVAGALDNLAGVLLAKGSYTEAEPLFREALAMKRRLLGNEHPSVAATLSNLAIVLDDKGDYAGAEALDREALAMKRRLLGNEHPAVATSLGNLAGVLNDKGDSAGAEVLDREALAMRRKLLGSEHPDVAESLSGLARVLLDKGDDAGAETLYREALAMGRKLLGNEHPTVAVMLTGLAETLCHEHKPIEAEALAREALAIRQKASPGEHPDVAEAKSVLGECLADAHQFEEAEPLLLGSYLVLKSTRGEGSVATRKGLQRIVALYQESGRPEKAAPYRALLAKSPPSVPASPR
jgi:serine/threonine protein kinase/tetratricopeptide (TPR) repeat protein